MGQPVLLFPASSSPCEISSLEMIYQKLLQGKGLLLRKEELSLYFFEVLRAKCTCRCRLWTVLLCLL